MSQSPEARAAARHEEVLGQPPRLPPLDRQSVAEQVQADTQRLRGSVVADQPPLPLDAIPEIMFTMCRYPGLWQKLMDLTVEIQGANAVLPLRDRKLAILRTGWLCQAPYEFGEHVNQAHRAGFTAEEVERITVGSTASEWNEHERAILRAVEELHADTMISDETWGRLAKRLSEHQLVELLILVGQFVATAYFQNALRLRLEPGNRGLTAR
ncbi:MAG: carboxymuconolactone decarboxylase family protein [Novosphingobium sp.]|nr:carboxymuconolactone decarboxylase family protein [Novosphingobium sp.]